MYSYSYFNSERYNAPSQDVAEGVDLIVDLSVERSANPFPPKLSSMWLFNGQSLSNSSTVSFNDSAISFENLQRNMSGIYYTDTNQ